MAKLSQQILADAPTTRSTRSERVRGIQAQQRDQKEIDEYNRGLKSAETKLKNADLETYESVYNSLDPKYSKEFMSPAELKQTSEYKQFEVEKKRYAEVQKWKQAFNHYDKYRRGKPFFLGLNPSSTEKREFAEVQRAMAGDPSSIPAHVVSTLSAGLTTSFSATPQVYGLDLGQKVKITTKDTASGEIKKEITFEKLASDRIQRDADGVSIRDAEGIEKKYLKGTILTSTTTYNKVLTSPVSSGIKQGEEGWIDIPQSVIQDPPDVFYNDKTGKFERPFTKSGRGTSMYYRDPTAEEKASFEKAQYGGDFWGKAITGIPAQFLTTIAGLSRKQLGEKDIEEIGLLSDKNDIKIGGKSIFSFTPINPITHYKVYKENYDLQKEVERLEPVMEDYEEYYQQYEDVKVTQKQVDQGLVTAEQIEKSNLAGSKVNTYVDYIEGLPEYQSYKSRGKITSVEQMITGSDASSKKKFGIGVAIGGANILPYLYPPTRIVMGADLGVQGIDATIKAETKWETALGVGQTALGGFVAYTGVKGLMPNPAGKVVKIGTGLGSLTTRKIITHATIFGVSGGVGALDSYGAYKRTGSLSYSVGSGVGTAGGLLTGAYWNTAMRKLNDLEVALKSKRIYTPKISEKPFARSSAGGKGKLQEVFYKKYKGFKLSDYKTWKPTLKGQHKGTFLYREYRIIDPRVEAKFLGQKDATYWKYMGKRNYKLVTESAKTFPSDSSTLHKGWFDQTRNIQQYYLPKTSLNQLLKNYKTFGFSGTSNKWSATEFEDDVLTAVRKYGKGGKSIALPKEISVKGAYQFSSGKGGSTAFLRIGNAESGVVQIGGNQAQSPTLYANYFKGSQVNPAKAEVRAYSNLLKNDIKYYILRDQAKAGKIQIPKYKSEVEGVYEFIKRIELRNNFYANIGGRSVKIPEQVFVQGSTGGGGSVKDVQKIVDQILKQTGISSSAVSSTASYSSAIPRAYLPNFSSKFAIPYNPSRIKSISKIIKSSMVSGLSSGTIPTTTYSNTTGSGGGSSVSLKSLLSNSLSVESSALRSLSPIIDPVSTTPSRPTGIIAFPFGKSKIKKDKKLKRKIQDLLYLPDFTSRAIGLSAVTISEKQAKAKLKQLMTGLEIRRPIRVKGISPIDEKSLLMGIMK